ncbi:glycosyltransferase family 1 protein [Flammeovirga sp. SubArs3]|uniref:glycosyltransferase family 4 protein n=1 Tax=Flammeovirga sp. SubArs3 TaxID=2995316 RepID=UPI00248AB85B|nr:glycosyltransferase family 1 protein [Flammeovirga sp. SubArs3]
MKQNLINPDTKITLVSCQHFNSGIGRYSYQLGEGLRKLSFDTELYKVYKRDHTDRKYHRYSWINKIHYKSFRSLHPYILPYFIHRRIKNTPSTNLIHGHWFISGYACSLLKNPSVVTMHDVSLLHVTEASKWFTGYYKWVIQQLKKKNTPILVVSDTAKLDCMKYADYPEDLIYVSKNFINFNQFFPIENIAQIERKDTFNIIYTGGLGQRKNVGMLLKAMKIIEKKFPYAKLKIAGAFPEYTPYPKMAEEFQLRNVEFVGYIPDNKLNEFYNKADLFVFTSLYEGFGYTPLEAMSTKTPVISTKGGALHEIVGKGGDLVEYNVDELVEKISFYLLRPSKLEALGNQGFEWVKRYTEDASIKNTLKAYKKALA